MSSISSGTTTTTGYVVTSDTTGALVLKTGASDTTAVTIDASQNVGVGTASPAYKLDVAVNADSASSGIRLLNNSAGSTAASVFRLGTDQGNIGFLRANSSTNTAAIGGASSVVLGNGLAFPVVIATNGVERLRVDSAGNLGLGVTPSAWSTGKALQINNVQASIWGAGDQINVISNAYFNSGYKYAASKAASMYEQALGVHSWSTAASGTAGNAISFTQDMTLNSTGLVVGGTTPLRKLTSAGTSGELVLLGTGADGVEDALIGRISSQTRTSGSASTSSFASIEFRTGGFPWYGTGVIRFLTANGDGTTGAGAERARIDGSGNLLVGTTTTASGVSIFPSFSSSGASGIDIKHVSGSASGTYYETYQYNNSVIGYISQNGTTAVAYNTTSDYRLKNTISPITGALARVALLKPCTYKWNVDGSDGEGFIAHELAEVCPDAVTGEKDAVDADGKPQYQGIDTSFLVATLTAAIQEQQQLIQQLQADVAILKGGQQ